LAKSITLVESSLMEHQMQASALINYILHQLKFKQKNDIFPRSFRIGVSGPPGVGKSTFIEALGSYLITKKRYKVAVLAVDPSSVRSGGSILGDVTRMVELSRMENAYVRGSPSRGTLGGVTRSTGDSILLCEAASYNIIFVETVGVGQSETAVEALTDMFVMLAPPAGGDELQGIKKGIMELVDLIVINKADGELLPIAQRASAELRSALSLIRSKSTIWFPQVSIFSSKTKTGIEDVWRIIGDYWDTALKSGLLQKKRMQQRRSWMWNMIHEELLQKFICNKEIQSLLPSMETRVENGDITPGIAVDQLMSIFIQQQQQQSTSTMKNSRYN